MLSHRAASLLFALFAALAVEAKKGDIDAGKDTRRKVADDDVMGPAECADVYKVAGGRYFPQARPHTAYKPSDCATPHFWDGSLPNADRHKPGFDSLPVCLGMQENINTYLGHYPGKCRRLTSSAWTQDLNQLFVWCIATGHLPGHPANPLWLVNEKMMSKSWAQNKLKLGPPGKFDSLFVTASEACFWNKVMNKPFPLSGKAKREEKQGKKGK